MFVGKANDFLVVSMDYHQLIGRLFAAVVKALSYCDCLPSVIMQHNCTPLELIKINTVVILAPTIRSFGFLNDIYLTKFPEKVKTLLLILPESHVAQVIWYSFSKADLHFLTVGELMLTLFSVYYIKIISSFYLTLYNWCHQMPTYFNSISEEQLHLNDHNQTETILNC